METPTPAVIAMDRLGTISRGLYAGYQLRIHAVNDGFMVFLSREEPGGEVVGYDDFLESRPALERYWDDHSWHVRWGDEVSPPLPPGRRNDAAPRDGVEILLHIDDQASLEGQTLELIQAVSRTTWLPLQDALAAVNMLAREGEVMVIVRDPTSAASLGRACVAYGVVASVR